MTTTRYERRQKRKRTEEVMSWFLLPAIIVITYLIGSTIWTNLRESIPGLADLRALQEKVRR